MSKFSRHCLLSSLPNRIPSEVHDILRALERKKGPGALQITGRPTHGKRCCSYAKSRFEKLLRLSH